MQRFLLIVLLGWLPASTLADGMVFPPAAFPAAVKIPDQRAAVLLVGLVSAYFFTVLIRPGNPKFRAGVLLAFVISLLAGGMIYLFLPKIEVRLVKRPWEMRHNRFGPLMMAAGHTLEEARSLLAVKSNRVAAANEWGVNASNHYLGGEIHEEDSPGNFILREKDGEIELVIYDAQAAERVEATWRPKPVE
ncbi:MAG TPA: hypothetical protein VFZ59_05675 [Verrucomicrobiae bacterium]|nr:hypothetical protein [Verrucomicrobiae bacterium]